MVWLQSQAPLPAFLGLVQISNLPKENVVMFQSYQKEEESPSTSRFIIPAWY